MTGTALARVDPVDIAERLHASGLFKDTKSAQQALVKVLAGEEYGLGPVAAMNGIHIIDGKPVPSANVLAGSVVRTGRYRIRTAKGEDGKALHDNTRCVLDFYELWPSGEREHIGRSEFTMDDAKRAGLAGRTNWQRYPRNMLFARAVSNGVRWFAADAMATGQVLTAEEAADEANIEFVPQGATPEPTIEGRAVADLGAVSLVGITELEELKALYDASGLREEGEPDPHTALRWQLAALDPPAVNQGGVGECLKALTVPQFEQLRHALKRATPPEATS